MNIFYVYAYLDPRKPGNFIYDDYKFDFEPFYIGKGMKSRYLRHMKHLSKDDRNPIKINKINKIVKDGLSPIIIKIKENLSNEESLKLEIELIKLIGRTCDETGPLTNYSTGGETYIGYKHKQDYIDKLHRPVVKYDLDGNFIEEYESVDEAGKKNNTHPQTISQICGGDIKIFKNRYIFKYKEDPFEIRKRDKKQYSVIRIDYNLHEKEYESLTKASIENNIQSVHIGNVCMGNRFQCGGFLWRYKNHPKSDYFREKIDNKYGKYLSIMNKEIKVNNSIYKNILHVINSNKNIQINNIYPLLMNNKIYKFNEFKSN